MFQRHAFRSLAPSRQEDTLAVHIPAAACTLDGFRKWACSTAFPERGHISYIGGELIIDMSPEEFNHHNTKRKTSR
jgi:hypothetical protein